MPWNVIPQIFYDFIARVAPGALILILGGLTWSGLTKNALEGIITTLNTLNFGIVLIVGVLFSYVTGFLLQGLWDILLEDIHKNWSLGKRATAFKVTDELLYSGPQKLDRVLRCKYGVLKSTKGVKNGDDSKKTQCIIESQSRVRSCQRRQDHIAARQ